MCMATLLLNRLFKALSVILNIFYLLNLIFFYNFPII